MAESKIVLNWHVFISIFGSEIEEKVEKYIVKVGIISTKFLDASTLDVFFSFCPTSWCTRTSVIKKRYQNTLVILVHCTKITEVILVPYHNSIYMYKRRCGEWFKGNILRN